MSSNKSDVPEKDSLCELSSSGDPSSSEVSTSRWHTSSSNTHSGSLKTNSGNFYYRFDLNNSEVHDNEFYLDNIDYYIESLNNNNSKGQAELCDSSNTNTSTNNSNVTNPISTADQDSNINYFHNDDNFDNNNNYGNSCSKLYSSNKSLNEKVKIEMKSSTDEQQQRFNFINKIYHCLDQRISKGDQNPDDNKDRDAKFGYFAREIEKVLFQHFRNTEKAYKTQLSLILNSIRDKELSFAVRLLEGQVPLSKLATMKADGFQTEMAEMEAKIKKKHFESVRYLLLSLLTSRNLFYII
jgi:hypothetical protein